MEHTINGNTVRDILTVATDVANARINAYQPTMSETEKAENGSAAWQVALISTKGERKLQNQLKKLGYEKDSYWGYTVSAPHSNYHLEREWLKEFVRVLNEMGIKARRTERLL